MTSATFSRTAATATRRRVRAAAAAVSLVGVLALTACSGGGGSDDETSGSPSASATASADTGGTSGGTTAADGLQGSWLATTDGDAVALVVTGTEVGLFATGGAMCGGILEKESGAESGAQKIRLTCSDGNKDRAEGTVDSVGKTSLKVTWEGRLGTESFTRSKGGQLPSGLPTASLGS